ncbi:MAG TPA: RNA methyltransferase [Solirubrobacteraceae bacterium]|jgi:TrmH family RNA methyltransferase
MTTINSPHNAHLKEVRRLQRRRARERSGRFLAEGEDLIAAAARAGRPAIEGYRAAGSALGGEGFVDVEPTVLAGVSALGSGTRVIGVYEERWSESPAGPLCVYLHGVADPGNVGAVLRAAEAFGASCVAFGPGCADPHSPKAVRASMGAIFTVALAHAATPAELPGERVALVAHAGESLRELRVEGALTLLIGAEREGLPADLVAACERVAHIPIRSNSLNAAMAATVALNEMRGQIEDRGARRVGVPPTAPPSRVPPA